ncbi:ABC transporter ATP-binding protein [Campylobacter geochelonis]|uniref:Ferrichrome transport ATP-binding protein FhuC n=1 Tax=Campylobacter geochelonis TaxID=1780362 RepID=A0A128EE90_9BACT|nr:ABC transporter ATP-binding protein [Campylobacter geochelonis]QKF72086.1 heme ABC transporter ChuBCD, ATP-binding protein [Campylobacter geochelonis]CZE45874.1 ferrichrome transport ATP-binding protein FhuC [Campylobacter geochelonis]CZE46762.1 ferrichrome transport ATP-binding protein FhuC [Campylobacter geochelonis]CZE49825.1 ferrichrome transport ATP-binding protein FhuC [Campylobacter geochelonis]
MSLDVKKLEFGFGKKNILNNISLEALKGEFIGILGPNGCGKSTLLKNILQIYKPKSGIINIENKMAKEYSLKELSKIIGFVPQKSALAMPLLVEDIILMGRYSNLQSSFAGYSKEDYEAVDEVIKLLDLEKFKGRIAFSLSGGEFQRVILARALVSAPKILLLDEPTSALDLNYGVQILKICKSIIKKRNIIGVVILHDLNLASLFCDEILMIKDGEVAYKGAPNELLKKDILKEIYDLECEILHHENRAVVVPL